MTDGIYQSQDQLNIDDNSTYEANSPRRNSQVAANDGQGVYESVQQHPTDPGNSMREDPMRYTLGQTTGEHLKENQKDMINQDMNF